MNDLTKTLEKGKGKTLMVVFPHPDDETMATGGLLLTAKKLGWKTVVVILTKGGAGQMHVHPMGKTIKKVRTSELKKAAKILKVDELLLADFPDGELRNQKSEWIKFLEKKISKYKPGIVVTYDHSGVYGHPDHIVLSIELLKLLKKLNLKHTNLFWVSIPRNIAAKFLRHSLLSYMSTPTYKLDYGSGWARKWRAVNAHRSQKLPSGLKKIYALPILHSEWYHKVDLNRVYPHKFVNFKI